MKRDRQDELYDEFNVLGLDSDEFSHFLMKKLIACESALDSILEEIPNPSLPVTREIARIAREARGKTE